MAHLIMTDVFGQDEQILETERGMEIMPEWIMMSISAMSNMGSTWNIPQTLSATPTFGEVLALVGCDQEECDRFSHIVLPFRPFPHQLQGLLKGLQEPRFGLFFEPRTGKTLVLQLLAIYFTYHGRGTMVIMPPALFRQYTNDFAKVEGHGLSVLVMNGGPGVREKLLVSWEKRPSTKPHIVICSREIFKSVWPRLYMTGFNIVQFDESHLGLQNASSQIAKEIKAFANQNEINRLVLSSGTPIPNLIINAFCVAHLLDRFSYPTQRAFNSAHVIMKSVLVAGTWTATRTIQVPDRYINLDQLHNSMAAHSSYASKLDCLKLDAPNVQVVPCDLLPKHRTLYNKIINERILELGREMDEKGLPFDEEGGEVEILNARSAQKLRMTALQLVSVPSAFCQTDAHGEPVIKDADNAVYLTVQALLDSVNAREHEKVVIYANFTRTVEGLARRFKDLNPAIAYGPLGPDKSAKEVERFQQDSSCRVLIGNPQSIGVGFTLGGTSQTVIFAEPVSSPGAFDQCLSRVILAGQTQPVVAYVVCVSGTISPLAIDAMLGKAESINKIIRSKKTLLDGLLGIGVKYGMMTPAEERQEE